MELTKEQKIQLLEAVMWSYIEEETMTKPQLVYHRMMSCSYAGMCPRITKMSYEMFGESVYSDSILEFRAVTRKYGKVLNSHNLYFDAYDVKTRIEFLEKCISIC